MFFNQIYKDYNTPFVTFHFLRLNNSYFFLWYTSIKIEHIQNIGLEIMQKNILILSLLAFTCIAMERDPGMPNVSRNMFATTPAEIDIEILCRIIPKNATKEESIVAITALKNLMLVSRKLYRAGSNIKVLDHFMQHIAYESKSNIPIYMHKQCFLPLYPRYIHNAANKNNRFLFAALNINTTIARKWLTARIEEHSLDHAIAMNAAAATNRYTLITQLLKITITDSERTRFEHSDALRLAVLSNHKEAVQALLASPYVNINGNNGKTIFAEALCRGNSKIIRLLAADERTNITSIPSHADGVQACYYPSDDHLRGGIDCGGRTYTKKCDAVEYIERYCADTVYRGTVCAIDQETRDFVRKQVIKRQKITCEIQ